MDPSGTRQPPMQGPLQAFGNMQRALRDADKRLDALGQSQLQVATAVDGKLNKALRRMQEDNERLRKDTHDLLAELEQLTLQMYEEHTAELAASREAQSAQRSGLEALRDTQQATLEAQQAQIDALGAVVRKQQGMIDELASASAAQMAAVQGELSELGRGFSAQAAALDASRAHAAALEEKLAAQIEKRVNASELLGAASLEALDGRVEQQARTLKTVLEGHASYQDKYEQLLQWRVGADGGLQAMEQRVGTVEAGLERAREEARDGLRGAHEELRDTAAQWPEWAKAIEEAMRKLQAGKADSSMVDDACAALGDRIEAVGRQLAPLPAQVGGNSSSLQQLQARFDMVEPRADKSNAQLQEAQAGLQRLAKEMLETRGQAKAQLQQIHALAAQERTTTTAMTALETRVKHVGGMAEEHSRYLAQIGESLFAHNAVGYRYRTAAVVPSFAPPPPADLPGSPDASHRTPHDTAATEPRMWPRPEEAATGDWMSGRPRSGATTELRRRPAPSLGPMTPAPPSSATVALGQMAFGQTPFAQSTAELTESAPSTAQLKGPLDF